MCLLLLVLAALAGHARGSLLFVDRAVALPIYQWSRAGSFFNDTFLLFANATEHASSGIAASCVLLAYQPDAIAARAAIAQLPPNVTCAVVQAAAAPSGLKLWIVPNSILDTPFPVGVLFGPLGTFVPPSGVAPVRFLGWDYNYYLDSFWLRVAFFIVLLAFNLACAGWGTHKEAALYRLDPRINVATVCIALETLSALFRALDDIITLVYFTRPWADGNRNLDAMFTYIAGSCSISSGIFVIFFWIDVTSSSLYTGCFLDKALGPCVFFVASVFALIYVCAILQVFYPAFAVIIYVQLVFLLFLVVVSLIYFVAAFRVARYLRNEASSYSKERKGRLMKISYKIVVSGVLTIFMAFCSLGYLLSATVAGSIACDFLIAFATIARSALVISIFGTPKKEKSGTSGTGSSPKTGKRSTSGASGTSDTSTAPKMIESHSEM
jgi:hypothetical protein